jgi:hypothetical protein
MTPHLPDPSGISYGTYGNRHETDQRDPFELLWSMEHNSHNMMGQFEQRDKTVFDPGKR